MADRLSAIFALFAVTWKITLKTAPNKGSKNGTQNHFSESSMTLFRYFVCISPKSRNERSATRTWHQYKMAQLHAANRHSVRQAYLNEGTRRTEKLRRESIV